MNAVPAFAVNGRFLGQTVTGVQRYARNVVDAMNTVLTECKAERPILVPPSVPDPGLAAMPLRRVGRLSGHLWEQTALPLCGHGRLLNLCNTAPALKADQIVCIHDANVFVSPESYSPTFRAAYLTLHHLIARRSVRITTVSAASARQIAERLPVRAADIAVIPNGHEHALVWDPALARIRDMPPTAGGVPFTRFALAIGSRARHKNLGLLLEIAPRLAEMGLGVVVAGGGGGIFSPDALAATPQVSMIGYVSDHDLAYLMDRAECLFFPSWTEGFGLPLIEAMARGCPVISSDRASMPEICGHAALMASPDDPEAWLGHVRDLVASRDLRQDLVGRGRERVRLFSWPNAAAAYLDLLYEPRVRSRVAEVDQSLPKIAVVVATLGRPETVTATLGHLLDTQSLQPGAVIVSCVARQDAGEISARPGVTVITGRRGLAAQRNAALAVLPAETDVVVFFDDDFVADADWLLEAARAFRNMPQLVAFTGQVIADGIKGRGFSFEEATRFLANAARVDWSWVEPYSPYGCNMAFRMSAICDLKFDERLVLYGWLEDRDFAGALAKRGGRLVKGAGARGVHMGVKGGRISGDRLGYSQVVNPIYMLRKGTMNLGQVTGQIFRNFASNLFRSARPEPFIDRRGRLRGNLRGLIDVVRGCIEPERAATIKK